MLNKNRILALIPARGASKSIKKKNLVKINNKTLIERIFYSLKKSKYIDKIVCSSENKLILDHCKKLRLNSVKRPKKLALDNSDVFYTAKHCINFFKRKGEMFDILILAQPTSPFLKTETVNKIIKILTTGKKYSSSQTIHKTPHNYHYLNSRVLNKGNVVKFKFLKERKNKVNKQKKPTTYSFGNLIACKIDKFLKSKDFFCQPCKGIIVDKFSSFDFDSKEDFEFLKRIN